MADNQTSVGMVAGLERPESVTNCTEAREEQALADIRVLDLTQLIAGPYCTKLLAGFGAEVIKLEKPGAGDRARSLGPFLNDIPGTERSGLFLYLNSNKKSITLNLKSAAGVSLFKEMVRNADVVVESFRPGVMREMGLDYAALSQINPGLILTSVSNFGQAGPYRDYKASHLIFFGMSAGRGGLTGERTDPIQPGGWLTHYEGGAFAAAGTAAALYQRLESGAGQHVDTSMWESAMSVALYPGVLQSYFHGRAPGPRGRPHLGILPCKDGYVGINTYTTMHWELVCSFFGLAEECKDPRKFNDQVRTEIHEKVRSREKMDLFLTGGEWRLPFGLVPTTQEIADFPQHKARGFFEEVDHPVMGKVKMPGAPFKMMDTPWKVRSAAPLLGEHNEEIYCGRLGYSAQDLARLRSQGVI